MDLFSNRKRLTLILAIFVLASTLYLGAVTSQESDSVKTQAKETLIINALGDSITYGSGLTDNEHQYANQIGDQLGADKVNNYGIPSSPISNTVNPALTAEENEYLSFLDRASDMDKDADIIFVFGGANDYSLDVPIGTEEDTSSDTFSGALNLLFHALQNTYPKSSIYALTPLRRYDQIGPNEAGHRMEDYANQINAIADNYDSICSIDLFHAEELDFTKEGQKELLVDGLHPSDEGQTKIAKFVVASITP